MVLTTHFVLYYQTTRLDEAATRIRATSQAVRGYHPLWQLVPEHFYLLFTLVKLFKRPQLDSGEPLQIQPGLIPLPSPVLGESLLVSFPPLNYMLKFSG